MSEARAAEHLLGDLGDAEEPIGHRLSGLYGDIYLSSGETLVVAAALDLFNGGGGAKLGELIRVLDDDNYRRLIEALEIVRPVKRP